MNFTYKDPVFYLSVIYATGLLVYLPALTLPILTMVEEVPFIYKFIYKDVLSPFHSLIHWDFDDKQHKTMNFKKKLIQIVIVTISGIIALLEGDFLGIVEITGSILISLLAVIVPILMYHSAFNTRKLSPFYIFNLAVMLFSVVMGVLGTYFALMEDLFS